MRLQNIKSDQVNNRLSEYEVEFLIKTCYRK